MINAPDKSSVTQFSSPHLKSSKFTDESSSLCGSSKPMLLAITEADSKAHPIDKRNYYSLGTVEALN
jgi:hypothetical protein